ncbi:MAG TPA: AbrB/MazE/SpoVT family DNA-binding domain-containing protein [Bryobacterales bacterium]|nr:AbrB/MazE/SpoVT family DNA-binding domain-containing protein [Bryobacterales bacterium]
MLKTKVSSKGQITLPKAIREQLGIAEGTELAVTVEDGTIQLQKMAARWRRWEGALAGTNILEELEREHRWEIERDEARARGQWPKS